MTQSCPPPVFELRDVTLLKHGDPLIGPFSLAIRDRAVTAILGPAGTGKSTLLRALSGQALAAAFSLRGEIDYRGATLSTDAARPAHPVQGIAFAQQHSNRLLVEAAARPSATPPWRHAMVGEPSTVLLDEPTRGCSEGELDALRAALDEQRARGCAVVVTHDVGFMRAVADDVCLFVAGNLVAAGNARALLSEPLPPLLERFLAQGNCWPAPAAPPLPPHFRWVLPGRLAGMGRPGLVGDVESDLCAIASAGIELLVTLTEEPPAPAQLSAFGLQSRHFPIRDMGVPALGAAARLCSEMERRIESGQSVAVHCMAGLGRTGTILAAFLVWTGTDPQQAIAQIRRLSPGYIQTRQQEQFVHSFAEQV